MGEEGREGREKGETEREGGCEEGTRKIRCKQLMTLHYNNVNNATDRY